MQTLFIVAILLSSSEGFEGLEKEAYESAMLKDQLAFPKTDGGTICFLLEKGVEKQYPHKLCQYHAFMLECKLAIALIDHASDDTKVMIIDFSVVLGFYHAPHSVQRFDGSNGMMHYVIIKPEDRDKKIVGISEKTWKPNEPSQSTTSLVFQYYHRYPVILMEDLDHFYAFAKAAAHFNTTCMGYESGRQKVKPLKEPVRSPPAPPNK